MLSILQLVFGFSLFSVTSSNLSYHSALLAQLQLKDFAHVSLLPCSMPPERSPLPAMPFGNLSETPDPQTNNCEKPCRIPTHQTNFCNDIIHTVRSGPVMKILERGKKWNGVSILSCKIWHGQENNGMASRRMSNCGIAAKTCSCLTGRVYPDGCSETRKWKNSKFYVRHEVLKKKD